MQKYIRLIILFTFFGFNINLISAQTTILDQNLLGEASFNTFTPVSVTGTQSWHYSNAFGAVCSGYSAGQSYENEDWLVSSAMNLSETDNVELTFSHTRGNAAVMNAGVAQGWYEVFATAAFTGDPATTVWTLLEGLNQNVTTAWQFIPSGVLIIPDGVKSENTRIAFRYMCNNSQSATWEIKNVKVTGEPQATNPNSGLFRIVNWNIEWLGCTLYGPSDENLQINNTVAAMLSMNADIYCIQEVTNNAINPTIETIVSLMGSDEWEGSIVPSPTDDCDQRQGIIYKKSKVQLVSSAQLSSGIPSQGNSYYYNWASGRYPALYNINVVSGNTTVPLSLVNIHAKAEDGNAMSYARRLGASEALKTILDGVNYNTKKLIVIGDFNDYLIGTSSNACACTVSPYQNFVADVSHYQCTTQSILDVNTTWGIHPIIEHMIISDELFDYYNPNSVVQEVSMYQNIDNYLNTTSNHLPVSATFQFATLGTREYAKNTWSIYPNPVKDLLKFDGAGLDADAVISVYDLTGRQMRCEKISVDTVNVSDLPSGVYILKTGLRFGRFVKE